MESLQWPPNKFETQQKKVSSTVSSNSIYPYPELARAIYSGENVRGMNLPETGGALPGLQRRRSQLITGSLPEVTKELLISYRSFDRLPMRWTKKLQVRMQIKICRGEKKWNVKTTLR